MQNKKFILNADDFGINTFFNQAIFEAYNFGILKSSSICTNGEAYEDAITNIIPNCPNLSIGVHLNIIEGKALCKNLSSLTNKNNEFNNGFIQLLLKSFNKTFLKEVELEFKTQIEKAISSGLTIDHLDSHVHVHAIPNIFNIVCKLAKEYNIKQVRTQYEHFYFTPQLNLHKSSYFVNLIKHLLLNTFSMINKPKIKKFKLTTNNYIIGVTYTGMMNQNTLYYGLKAIKKNSIVEALIHPCKYDTEKQDSHTKEFELTINASLKEKIKQLNYEITNYQKN